MVGQTVGLGIVLAADVGDGKFERADQLLADPMQGIEARTAAGVLACHLSDYHFGIGIDVKCLGFQLQSTLQSF